MRTRLVGYRDIHRIVDNNKDVFWDGWTAVFVDRRYNGMMQTNGIFYDDQWCVQYRSAPDSSGRWAVPARYAKPS